MVRKRCAWAETHPLMTVYHDEEYGIPLHDDDRLFERLVLEQMQAGLSWLLVLKKRDSFRKAFNNFSIKKVARYGERDIERLLNDETIIRNRRKIEAAIENARRILAMQQNGSGLDQWLCKHAASAPTLAAWTALFKQDFVFTGTEIVNEFLHSINILPISHDDGCWLNRKPRAEKFIGS